MRKTLISTACTLLCTLFFLTTFAQTRTISGVISDEKGTSLPGASVKIKGSKIGTQTNVLGKFSFTVPSDSKILVVSFVGMETQEVSVAKTNDVSIVLKFSSTALGDVVVIGYGSTKRAYVTSAISSVSEKDLKNIPVAGVDQMLQGKVAGVTVTDNSGQPGGGVSVLIRGVTSVTGSNQPLYVIDGVPIQTSTVSIGQDQLGGVAGQTTQSPLATLNPSDIASVDILKDASAQAIYGANGANGVILITTKHGQAGAEGKLSYDVSYGWQNVQKQLPLMNLQQYAQYYNSVVTDLQNDHAIDPSVGTIDSIGEFKNPSVLGEGTNWQDAVFQTGNIQNHQLSFSGGQGKTTYYFSGNYYDQIGTVVGSAFKRYAARIGIDQQVKSWLKAGISANFSRTDQKITLTDGQQSVISLVLYNSPASPVKSFDGSYINQTPIQGVPFGNTQNPIALALLRDVQAVQSKAFGNIYADIQITKDINFRNQLNYDFQLNDNTAFQPQIASATPGIDAIGPSKLRLDQSNSYYYGIQSYLTYNHSFGKNYVNVIAGHEASVSEYSDQYATANNLTLNLESLSAGTIDPANTGSAKYPGAGESVFGRAIYSYDNKYSLTASFRRDGSSSFGPDKRWGSFPAASVGWTITNENFAKNWKPVNFLKLRLGVGSVGSSDALVNNAYTTNIRLVPSINGLFGQTTVAGVPANVGNPFLSWASIVTYNGGVDASFLNKRIEASVDVYQKVTTNMILPVILPSFGGLDPNPPLNNYKEIEPPVVNAGKMTNTGVDISLTTHNIQNKNFSWTTNIIFSHYKNIVNYLTTPGATLYGKSQDFAPQTLTVTQAGYAVGSFYGFETDGLYRMMSELMGGPATALGIGVTDTWLGDIRYKDLDGNDTINSKDQGFIGNPNPKFTYGITNTFSFKGFDLSVFLTGVYGDQIYNYSRMLTESLSDVYYNQLSSAMDRYTSANTNGSLPRFNPFNTNNLNISDRFIENGSYLRIQNVSIGYNLPAKIISRIKMSSARIYISGQNLYTFTKYTGYDPELGSFNNNVLTSNIDYGHYPNPRSIMIGANIQF